MKRYDKLLTRGAGRRWWRRWWRRTVDGEIQMGARSTRALMRSDEDVERERGRGGAV